jgi:Ras GTPase-activating-like protein IQGAP2/3
MQHIVDEDEGTTRSRAARLDDRKLRLYGNLFYLLQNEPQYMATLLRLVTLDQMDNLLQIIMFTLYGNQYNSREEYLLLSMFKLVLAYQFDQTTEFGSLLRANTPVSRILTTYTRRGPGQAYLKSVFSDRIASLIKHRDLNLEINPVKVYQQILETLGDREASARAGALTPLEAASIPQVHQLVESRVRMLLEIANSFLTIMIDNLDAVPYGIRWICKQIKGLAKRKYPTATDWQICSLIGGFFMLRFVNPAIVTPQAYMLVPSAPSLHPRRTLTMLAKMLQNLANKPTKVKESYMAPLHVWSEENKDRVQHFLLSLTEVDDFYEALELGQYAALSRRREEANMPITYNEIISTHSLLLKHQSDISFYECRLDVILKELGPASSPVLRSENVTYTLNLFSKWETSMMDSNSLVKRSTDISPSEAIFLEAKSLFVQVLRRVPSLISLHTHEKGYLDLWRVLEGLESMVATDPMLKEALNIAPDLLNALEQNEENDGHKALVDEVMAELALLGERKAKLSSEFQSLQTVYGTICEHNEYLRSQLDTYKAYLANVRLKSTEGALSHNSKKSLGLPIGVVSPSPSTATSGSTKASKGDVDLNSNSTKGESSKGVTSPVVGTVPKMQRKSFSHAQLDRDGILLRSLVPENRRTFITLGISSPSPGSFVISLDYKGRERPILEMDLRLDDLLEKQQEGVHELDLEYLQLHVVKFLQLLNKQFLRRNQ